MTDDLVKRLRDRDAYAKSNGWDNVVFGQAADRIEELEKQTEELAAVVEELIDEDAAARIEELEGAIRQIVFDAIQLSRAALKKKQ